MKTGCSHWGRPGSVQTHSSICRCLRKHRRSASVPRPQLAERWGFLPPARGQDQKRHHAIPNRDTGLSLPSKAQIHLDTSQKLLSQRSRHITKQGHRHDASKQVQCQVTSRGFDPVRQAYVQLFQFVVRTRLAGIDCATKIDSNVSADPRLGYPVHHIIKSSVCYTIVLHTSGCACATRI